MRGDTSESISPRFISHALSSRWQDYTFSKVLFFCCEKNIKNNPLLFSQFPISHDYGSFSESLSVVTNKVFSSWERPRCLTTLNGKLICIYFVAFSQRLTAFPTQCHSKQAWERKGKVFGCRMNSRHVFPCVLQGDRDDDKSWVWMELCARPSSGIKSVWETVDACSSLYEHRVCLNVQGAWHVCCSQDLESVKKKCNKQVRWKTKAENLWMSVCVCVFRLLSLQRGLTVWLVGIRFQVVGVQARGGVHGGVWLAELSLMRLD